MTQSPSQPDLERRLREAELFARITTAAANLSPISVLNTVCQEVAAAIGVSDAAFAQLDANNQTLTVISEYRSSGPSALGMELKLSEPLTQEVIVQRRAVTIDDVLTHELLRDSRSRLGKLGIRSLLVVPVIAHGQVIGSIGLDAYEPHRFSQDDLELVTSVIRAAAPALEQTRLYEQLRHSFERYEALVETLDGVVWEAIWNGKQLECIFISPQVETLFGHPREAFLGNHDLSVWKDVLHPSDLPVLRNIMVRVGRSLVRTTAESRAFHRDGRALWLRDQISGWLHNGQVHIRGLILDITAQKRASELERDRNEVLQLIAQGQPLQVTLERLRIMAAAQTNGVGSAMILFDQSEFAVVNAVGMTASAVDRLHSSEGQAFLLEFAGEKRLLRTGEILNLSMNDPRLVGYSGQLMGTDARQIAVLPVRSSNADLLAAMLVFHNETVFTPSAGWRALMDLLVIAIEHDRLMQTLEFQATHDQLTRLPNRNLYHQRLEMAMRDFAQVGLLSLDLNGFKQVNDRFGHSVGDELLVGVAETLRTSATPADTVARLGGDEFVMVLPNASRADCLQLAETIRSRVDAFQLENGASVTASVGVALYPADAIEADELYRAADRAMYAEKHR